MDESDERVRASYGDNYERLVALKAGTTRRTSSASTRTSLPRAKRNKEASPSAWTRASSETEISSSPAIARLGPPTSPILRAAAPKRASTSGGPEHDERARALAEQ